MKVAFVSLLFVSLLCRAEEVDPDSWKHPEPITHESLTAWHARGGLGKYHWPKEHKADLNGDGKDEVFLGVSGFGRGMIYALFTEQNGKWVSLSVEIEGSHHSFELLEGEKKSWRNFRSLQPSGRGGLVETIYSWNGSQYIDKSSREISAEELSSDKDEVEAKPSEGVKPVN